MAKMWRTPGRLRGCASEDIKPGIIEYPDPVSHAASTGAFAPVGGTGLVVVVATPRSAAAVLTDRILRTARSGLGVPLLLGVALLAALLASLHLARPQPQRRA